MPRIVSKLRDARCSLGDGANRLLAWAVLVVFVLLHAQSAVAAQSRGVALVIGNSAYEHSAVLNNPMNDANDVALALEAAGFTVVKGIDLDRRGMERSIVEFARALKQAEVGLFFYAGHALQIGGQNYLVPIDAQLIDSTGVDFELVRLSLVQRAMERSAKTNMIFMDACRNNPLSRNLARAMGTRTASLGAGLAPVESGIGTLISYSTQPGNVALDGTGRNSPYSGALARHIRSTNGDITDVLINVRRDVMMATNRQQIPWEHSALTSKFYFKSQQATPTPPGVTETRTNSFDQQAELAFWQAVRGSDSPEVIETYVNQYPQGKFATLARVLIEQLRGRSEAKEPERTPAKQASRSRSTDAKPSSTAPTENRPPVASNKRKPKTKTRPTTRTATRNCRRETKTECRIRNCGSGQCRHLRGTGVCRPNRRRRICE